MAMDKNLLRGLLTKIPAIGEKDIPELPQRIKHVDTQIEQFKGSMYRLQCDLKVAKYYATKDDSDATQVAENKIRETTGSITGVKWTLHALRDLRAELEVEVQTLPKKEQTALKEEVTRLKTADR